MLTDISMVIQKLSENWAISIGYIVIATIICLIYFLCLVVIIVLFFNSTFKEAFFGENKRATFITSLFFLVYVAVGSLYGTIMMLNSSSIKISTLFYFSIITAAVITVITKETSKKLIGTSTVFYDAIISFVALLIFLTPTKTMTNTSIFGYFLLSFGMIFSLLLLPLIIKRIKLTNNIIPILYGKKKV